MTTRLQYEATVSGGKLQPSKLSELRVQTWLAAWQGRAVLVTIEPERKRRSLRANRRYFGCIVPWAAEILSVSRDVPISSDQAHYVLKSAFLGVEETPLGPVPKRTKDLTSAEFSQYCERITAHFAAEGYQLPALEDPCGELG